MTGGNIGNALAFLEPMHTAVVYDHSGLTWVDNFDPNPASPTYNPVPIVTDGTTPINSSLLEAFDWYKDQKTIGDWASDPFEGCREWYVILITDGDDSCEFETCNPGDPGCTLQLDGTWKRYDLDRVCDPDQGADKFAKGAEGVDPLPVYTIGFSESVSADSPLKCIADQTGGKFMTAENATQLSEALYNVFYNISVGRAPFSPFKVAPPPVVGGGDDLVRDYLAVYPLFLPQEGQTLWAGNLYGFELNKDQPTLPTVNDCELDTTLSGADAAASLRQQLDAPQRADPQRFVFMSSDHSGSLQQLRPSGTFRRPRPARPSSWSLPASPTKSKRNRSRTSCATSIRTMTATSATMDLRRMPVRTPLPGVRRVLPLAAGGREPAQLAASASTAADVRIPGESGVHNYQDFIKKHAKRRRVVLAGANDGMLHAIDGGVWDRDRLDEDVSTDIYDKVHDLEDGTELFGVGAAAVMDSLYLVTAGDNLAHTQPKYLVDGPITTSDAFIRPRRRHQHSTRMADGRPRLTTPGGRGIVALDITQPDPIGSEPDYQPAGIRTFPVVATARRRAVPETSTPRSCRELSDTWKTRTRTVLAVCRATTVRPTGTSGGPGRNPPSPASQSTTATISTGR